jgi:hypothetical protein
MNHSVNTSYICLSFRFDSLLHADLHERKHTHHIKVSCSALSETGIFAVEDPWGNPYALTGDNRKNSETPQAQRSHRETNQPTFVS